MDVTIERVSKSFGKSRVLHDVSLSVRHGEFISVLGPSGVGKTTLLRILAALETPDSGTVRSASGTTVLVFQDYVLFPFLTVHKNVAFGLEARKIARDEVNRRVSRLLHRLGIESQAEQYPAQLSAGQKQRVALARALAVEPNVLLLDEPLANLDKNLKRDTALYLRSVQREFGITTVCVTHDQEEAMAISDRVAVMLDGEIKQVGSPLEVYYRPVSLEVARFMGPVTVIPQRLFDCPAELGQSGDTCTFRPEQIAVRASKSGPFVVREVRHFGLYHLCILEAEGLEYEVFTSHPADLPCGGGAKLERVFARREQEAINGAF
ncbi:MAG: ABC transporter ATP-binding protein [Spirochaetaceae bacterium]|nr:MAG: ABC transporter ATP-binding protein [Spirochaetaceae bacterium]